MNDLLDMKNSLHFSRELPADTLDKNISRKVFEACFSKVKPKKPKNPSLVHVSGELLEELNIRIEDRKKFTALMSGETSMPDFEPYAMCYGGHQFGHWAGQLGDGRAINIAELDLNNQSWKFQLKGAGPTPYSRGSDGLAVLRSSIREYLCSEAMHNLRVPTTRALSLVKTGDLVRRDMMYDGNPEDEQGAIVCRISPSFIRFGSFEIFTARQDIVNLKKLVDYTIKHHFSYLGEPSKDTYLNFFSEVADKTREMIIHWQRVGFVHGVMNTDNMSILGLTMDYGPYGWLEDYNPNWTPNTTDAQQKRYRFGNQGSVGLWNLSKLASAIYPLILEVEPLQEILKGYKTAYFDDYHKMMTSKLGLYSIDTIPKEFILELEDNLTQSEIDYTLFFRELSNKEVTVAADFWNIVAKSSYLEESVLLNYKPNWISWSDKYAVFIDTEKEDKSTRENRMKSINPKYVLRNYMAQLAINDAEKGDYKLIDEFYQMLLSPYDDQIHMDKWYAKRPEWARHKVGCSMLSCSS